MNHTFAHLEHLVAAAELAAPEDAVNAWTAAAALGEDSQLVGTADGAYLMGYVYYQLGCVVPSKLERARQFLRSALHVDPSHVYARLYLGHIAFDEGNFAEALAHFDHLEPNSFSRRGQAWRDLKRQELRICCLLHLGQVAQMTREFEHFLQLASGLDDTDTLVVQELPSLLQATFQGRQNAA